MSRRLFLHVGLCLLTLSCGASPPPAAGPPKAAAKASAAPSAAPSPDPEPWRQKRPAPGPAGQLNFPRAEETKLPSGLQILVVHKAVPVASLSLVFRNGAAACPPGKSGLAALTARMLTEGTRRHPGVKLAEAVEQLGSTLDEDAGRDTSSLSLAVLSADLDHGLELLAEVVQQPAFAPADFERVQKEWLDGLRAERQAPERLSSLAGLRALLGAPHGSPVSGSAGDVQKLTIKDIADFHRKAYGSADAALVVVGDVQLAQVRASAERWFKQLGKGELNLTQPFKPLAVTPGKRILLVDRPGAVQSALFLAQPMPKRSEPGYEGRELLTRLFGGIFTSRLNLNLREEHAYTYGAHAQYIANRNWGAFYIATSVRTDVTADALKETVKELTLLRDPKLGRPLGEAEIGRARADLVQSLGAQLEYGARIGGSLTELWLYGLGADYYTRYPGLLKAETAESLTRVAAALDPEQMVIVVVGDRSAVEAPLAKLGYQVVAAPPELSE